MRESLVGHVALVAGGTRGAGRGISVALGQAGATVYVTGRTTRHSRSSMNRPETIEETAEQVTAAGGQGIAVRVDHSVPAEVRALVDRIEAEQQGRLDLLVNDVWGGDPLTQWDIPFWEQDPELGLRLVHQAVDTHIITSRYAVPLMVRQGRGLVIEVTDGISDDYRGNLYYDLAKASVIRLARAQADELKPRGVAAVALTSGFLRSEAMLDRFGVTEETWRDAIAADTHFRNSESPAFIGRAVVALATDPAILGRSGQAVATWDLAKEYGFTDADGTRPDWGRYFTEVYENGGPSVEYR